MAPDTRSHRGAHPDDVHLFGAPALAALRSATQDLSLLLSRGYAVESALKLVGDRHRLRARQRIAVRRCACADTALALRASAARPLAQMAGARLHVDALNLIVTVESALGRGVVLRGRDGCLRDLASVHGSYRTVAETQAAVLRIGGFLAGYGPREVVWYIDRPVSNSGRLAEMIEATARSRGWPWSAVLVLNPDDELPTRGGLVATSDSAILDRCVPWVNLAAAVLSSLPQPPWLVDLGD